MSPSECDATVGDRTTQRGTASIRTPFAARFQPTPLSSQNPPAPPPATSRDTTAAAPGRLPRPQQPPPKGVTVTTGMQNGGGGGGGGGLRLDSTLLAGFRWRNIGPANMG